MKIVIKLDEDVFTRLFDNGIQDNEIAVDDVCEMARALRLGTPLPEDHGDLIDRDKLQKSDLSPEPWYSPMWGYSEYEVEDTPAVIKATNKSDDSLKQGGERVNHRQWKKKFKKEHGRNPYPQEDKQFFMNIDPEKWDEFLEEDTENEKVD